MFANKLRSTQPLPEWFIAGILAAIVMCLHIVRACYAGPLWRDEIAVVNLARMTWVDMLKYFPHEAFPLPFPVLVRGYLQVFGNSTIALRAFGCSVGATSLAAVWLSSRLLRSGPPVVSTVLFGFSSVFFIWGDSVRGYGLGASLIIVTFALLGRTLINTEKRSYWLLLCAALLSVHVLLANAVLLFAVGTTAAVIHGLHRQFRHALAILGIGIAAAISLLPYLPKYHSAKEWDIVIRGEISFRWLLRRFCSALASPVPQMVWVWAALIGIAAVGAVWLLWSRSLDRQERALLLFGSISGVVSAACYGVFLKLLSYPTQDWYYLVLIAVMIVCLDVIVGLIVDKVPAGRLWRLVVVVIAATALALPAFRKASERMTNMDLLVQELNHNIGQNDFVVVLPWYDGISFRWYEQTPVSWQTLPPIGDLRLHRYDLFKQQMSSTDPVGAVIQRVADTLKAGHRVWLVGQPIFLKAGQPPPHPAPAPFDPIGWSETGYQNAWAMQLGDFIRTHALHASLASPKLEQRVNPFEHANLLEVGGWQNTQR